MTQKERNIYLKNQQAQNAMEKIIKTMKKRDTEGNIQNIQREIDELNQLNNPMKNSISMYKIKQKMD